MVNLLELLFSVIWQEELVSSGITLLSIVGKVFCKILNNRLEQYSNEEGALHEEHASFSPSRACIDNVYTSKESVHCARQI